MSAQEGLNVETGTVPTSASLKSSPLNGGKWLEPLRNWNPQNFITLPLTVVIAHALVKRRNSSNVLHDFCSSDTCPTSWLTSIFVEIRGCCILLFLVTQQGKFCANLGHSSPLGSSLPGSKCRVNAADPTEPPRVRSRLHQDPFYSPAALDFLFAELGWSSVTGENETKISTQTEIYMKTSEWC